MVLRAKDNLMRALRGEQPAYVPWWGEGVCRLVDYHGRRPPAAGRDEWGVTWGRLAAAPAGRASRGQPAGEAWSAARAAPGSGLEASPGASPGAWPGEHMPGAVVLEHPAAAVRELLDRPLPDGRDPRPFARLLDGCDRQAILPIGRHPPGMLDRLSALLGAMPALLALAEEPQAAQAVLDRIADYHIAIARNYLAAGVEAGWLADDYAGRHGPLLSPALWRALILPGLARIIATYRAAGALVFFHTCGEASALLPDLLAAGVTAFNLETAACDLPALRARYGRRIAFVGGVPADLVMHGRPDAVRRAVGQAKTTLGRHGGLLLAPDQWLDFPAENVAAFEQAARAT